jgi:carbon starvation protein
MFAILVLIVAVVVIAIGYGWYGRNIDRNIIQPDPSKVTPAKMFMDGVDFTPASRNVLFGYQFKSIAALGPIIGPIVALRWGWLPALLWILGGVFFIGWVQDYGSAVVAMREEGKTFGALSYIFISPRSRTILLIFIYCYLWLIMAAFGIVAGFLMSLAPFGVAVGMIGVILAGLLAGQMTYKWKQDIILTTVVTVILSFVLIWVGTLGPVKDALTSFNNLGAEESPVVFAGIPFSLFFWTIVVMVICYLGSVLPIWRWAQPINYVSFWIVVLGMVGGVLGLLVWVFTPGSGLGLVPTEFPAWTNWNGQIADLAPMGPLWPMLFVTIACGAISGWHSLVSSSGTSRQIEKEVDALPVGGGAMFLEGFLAVFALLTAVVGVGSGSGGLVGLEGYVASIKGGSNAGPFAHGLGEFLTHIGIPRGFGVAYAFVFLTIMALTIMYLVVRFMRVASADFLGDRVPIMKNMHVGSIVALILSLIMVWVGQSQGGPIGGFAGPFFTRIWVLFGGSNQLMAALALLIITLWLLSKGKNYRWTFWPFLFMFVTTVVSLIISGVNSFADIGKPDVTGMLIVGDLIAGILSVVLIVCALILAWDGWQAIQKARAEKPAEA